MLSKSIATPRIGTPSRVVPRQVRAKATEDIYVGNGKFVKDDPSKYPSRDGLGVGGWAGGEQGLQQFLEQQKLSKPSQPAVGPATKLLGGRDIIYTGKGNYVRDDSKKYPSRNPMTGGFAGGERGVKKFVSEGSIEFNEPGSFRRQNSPLIVALGMVIGAVAVSSIWFIVAPQ